MNIKCPYYDNESPLSQWKVYVDDVYHFFEDKTICKKICIFATCPICNKDVSLSSNENIELEFDEQGILQNPEDVKKAIENIKEDVDDKLFYCPQCKKWKCFYEFDFVGKFVDDSDVLIDGNYNDIKESSKIIMLIREAKCSHCDYKVSIKPIKVAYPFNEKTKLELYEILRNIL